jgi:adenylosuccinate synthase
MEMKPHVLAIIGAQYGSEGKGVIVHHLADKYDIHVRVGGPQAGHSFRYNGQLFKMRVLPCGWTNPNAIMVLGRGMMINFDVLVEEIETIRAIDPNIIHRILIDDRAGAMDETYTHDPYTQKRLTSTGSTGEGVGAARVARIQRDPNAFFFARQVAKNYGTKDWAMENMLYSDTPTWLEAMRRTEVPILLEGTQGSGLSLIHGAWPHTTNHDTNAAQLAADIGMPPHYITNVMLVARTYPIRIASPKDGSSGPLESEITWNDISKRTGRKIEEKTTVTNRIRRIGIWDEGLLKNAIILNGPTSIAITFMDYLAPEDTGVDSFTDLGETSHNFIRYIETLSQVKVPFIGTGDAEKLQVIDRGLGV